MILELEKPIVFFDLETTGLDVVNDRIVEVGLVKLHPDGTRESLVQRVDPGIDIPESATKVHGIHNDEVRGLFGRPRLPRVGKQILAFLGDADLAGFNCLEFDLPLWQTECRRHSLDYRHGERRVVDVKLIFNARETGWDRFLMGPRNLSAAVRHYCGRDLPGAHSADADAAATIDVMMAQLKRHPDLPRRVGELHVFCEQLQRQQRLLREQASQATA
jgi:DNA polymerase-3 subunit epsilon